MSTPNLPEFAHAIASGTIRVVDLTQTLSAEFPSIVLPPEFGQCAPFRLKEVSRYDERGPPWYWNNFTVGERRIEVCSGMQPFDNVGARARGMGAVLPQADKSRGGLL
jgi:hypothetical protein